MDYHHKILKSSVLSQHISLTLFRLNCHSVQAPDLRQIEIKMLFHRPQVCRVLCSQQFFTGCDRCLLLLPAVERLLFLPTCSHPLTEVITEEASDRSVLVLGKNCSLALNFIISLKYFGKLFLQWANRYLNTVLDFGGSMRTEELRISSFSTAG